MSSYVVVPLEKISETALTGLIDEFILREGTDYGQIERTLAEKHQQVKQQLLKGQSVVVFDSNEQSASIVKKVDLKQIKGAD